MPFDPLVWAIGYISTKVMNKVINTVVGDELTRNLRKEAKDWEKTLPESYQINPEVFFLPDKDIDLERFPKRSALCDKLTSNQIPSRDVWFNAFIEHRDERRKTLKDDAHIFLKTDNVLIDPYLKDLADRFNNACVQTPCFFQRTVIDELKYQRQSLDQIKANFIQGIDERELAEWLENLTSIKKSERKKEVQEWYEEKKISSNLKEALNTVIERIDIELKASRETIEKLKAENKPELAKLLERLNNAFEKGLNELEKEEAEILHEIEKKEKKIVENKIEVYLNTAEKYETALQFYQALERYTHAHDLQVEYFGFDNEKLSFTLNQMGLLSHILALHSQAINHFEQALKIDLKTHGPDHPSVAIRWNNLGLAWDSKGEYDKAIEYFNKALASDLKTHGPDHPSVARTWNNLGSAWKSKGEYDKAIEYFNKALASDLKTHGPDHPSVAIRWNNLGLAWKSKGEYDKAIEYFDKALASDLKTHGPDHPSVARTWNNLGSAWSYEGGEEKACRYLRTPHA
ncbi:MAG: tetratricopeptide repeat protein, partial [Lentisphaerae bacterium]|nr:tetratricopeptide repeat protein [Lentisphaerota bacterium]